MRNIIIDLQNSDTWGIQLLTAINFASSKMLKKSVQCSQGATI